MKIVLGSKSLGRQSVLKEAGFDFDIMTADIDEKQIRHTDPRTLVLELARAKAGAILQKIDFPALLITADQVVVCGGRILEKPSDEEEARDFLRGYSRYPMETVSSVFVKNTANGRSGEGVDISTTFFRPIPEEAIDEALKIGRIMHCSGAMRCEEPPLSDYVVRLEGTKDSTSGMPLQLLKRLMNEVDYQS